MEKIQSLPNQRVSQEDPDFMEQIEEDWHTLLQIKARCQHLNLFIGPPASGKTSLIKHILSANDFIRSLSAIETEDWFANADSFATLDIDKMFVKGEELYVKCPDLENINLTTSFFLERLLRITLTVRVVLVVDYKTVTDNASDLLWTSLLQVTRLMTNTEMINNVGLIVTKICESTKDEATLKCLQDSLVECLLRKCGRTTQNGDAGKVCSKTANMFNGTGLQPQNIGLFKTSGQGNSILYNSHSQAMFETILESETKNFSFAFGVDCLKPTEQCAMAERCHNTMLNDLHNKINRFHTKQLVECTKDTLENSRLSLLQIIDYMDKLYTGRKLSDGQPSKQPTNNPQYQVYNQFFIANILECHRVVMQFFKHDYDMAMQGIVRARVEKTIKTLLSFYPRWKNALDFMEAVDYELSQEDYQANRHIYNRKDIDYWGKANVHAQHGLRITSENFETFCENISYNFEFEDLEEPFGLAHLNDIIEKNLHDPILNFIAYDVAEIKDKEIVLLLGNMGTGKKTLIQHLQEGKLQSKVTDTSPRFAQIDDVYYIACPSLKELLQSENEIQAWITIKAILKNCKAMKCLQVVEINDLKVDAKQHLQTHLESYAAVIKDIEKHTNGLGLIVNNIESRDYLSKHSPEAEIRADFEQIVKNCEDDPKIRRLIEILLDRKDGGKSKICYFLRLIPDPKLAVMFTSMKKKLEKMIGNLRFVPTEQHDINFYLSNKAKVQLFSFLIGQHLENNMSESSCDILNTDTAIASIVETLRAFHDQHLKISNKNCAMTLDEFLEKITTNVQLDEKVIAKTIDLISGADVSEALDEVVNIFNKLAQRQCVLFNHGFGAVEHYLGCVQKFPKFFNKIHQILSTHSVQIRKTKYQVVRVTTSPSFDDYHIDHLNFQLRLDQITGIDNFKDDEFQFDIDNQDHIRHIYQLLLFAIPKIEQIDIDEEILVKANYLVTEKLPQEVLESAKALFLYANNTIFIDEPVNTAHRKVVMIAPTIELKISSSEVDTVFFVTHNFIDCGQPMGSVFGLYKSNRPAETTLLYHYDAIAKTFLDDYIAFLAPGRNHTEFQEKRLWSFVRFIESEHEKLMKAEYGGDYKNDQHHRAKNLIRHCQYLESLACQSGEPKNLLPRFRALAKQTAQHFTLEPLSRSILSHLYVALTTKVHSLENDQSQQLVLDAKQYLEALRTNIEQYNRAKEIRRIHQEYQQSVIAKTEEGKKFIADELVKKIGSLCENVNNNIDKLLNEVAEEANKARIVSIKLTEELNDLTQTMVRRRVFESMRDVTLCLGVFGIVTDNVVRVVEPVFNLAIGLQTNQNVEMSNYNLPHSVDDAISDTQQAAIQNKMLEKICSKDLETIMENLDNWFQVVDKLPNKNDKIEAQMANMRKDLLEFKQDFKREMYELKNREQISHIVETAKMLTEELEFSDPGKSKALKTCLKNLDDPFKQIVMDDNVKLARKKLSNVEKDLEKLQQFKEKIKNSMIPVLNDIKSVYNSCHRDLDKESEIGLDIKTWQMRTAFVQFRNFCAYFTGGFKMHDHMMDCLNQLEEGLNILLTIYKRFHEFQNRSEIMDYAGQFADASNNVCDNTVTKQLFHELSMSINESIIIEQYSKGLNGFQQWAFPFAKVYLADLTLPCFQSENTDSEQRVRALTMHAIANVQQIIDRMTQHNSAVVSIRDSSVIECRFDGGNVMPVFYTWHSEDHRDDINRIFRGEEVSLTTHLQTEVEFDAVKFSKIRLEFCAKYSNQQSDVDSFLEKANIQLKHSGRSFYKFRNRQFLITTETVSIMYSYANDAAGEPDLRNEVYNKLAQNRPVLSPYTEWKVQIIGKFEPDLWKDLEVDIKLTGFGQYANVSNDFDLEVEKNYARYMQ